MDEIPSDRFYPLPEAAKIMGKHVDSLKNAAERKTLKIVKSGSIDGMMGSEILRRKGGPGRHGLYFYENMLTFIPDLTEKEYNDWVEKMRKDGNFTYHITEVKGRGTCLRLPAAIRFYADMTMK